MSTSRSRTAGGGRRPSRKIDEPAHKYRRAYFRAYFHGQSLRRLQSCGGVGGGETRGVGDLARKTGRPRGRPELYDEEFIAELKRRRDAGESLQAIASSMEPPKSRQWVYALLTRPNPEGKQKRWYCYYCEKNFSSTAKYRPERCARCRRYEFWKQEEN